MALPNSPLAISMSQINTEFGLGNSLSAYRGVTWYTDADTTGTFPQLGAISMSAFYSKRKDRPISSKSNEYVWASSSTFTVPSNFVSLISLTVYIVGGGGQGAGWPSGAEGGGGGEGASLSVTSSGVTLTPGQQFSITVGAGGTGSPRVENGGAGGASTFGAGTTLATTARGGRGGTTGGNGGNLAANTNTSANGITRNYYLGGGTSGRGGAAKTSTYGGGGGASTCYDGNGDGVYNEGGTSLLGQVFSGTNAGYGGAGCGGGDRRIVNQGYWPGGGGGGADYNATGGNGAGGGIKVILSYMGTV